MIDHIPQDVLTVAKKLQEQNISCWLTGGCVRDFFLDLEFKKQRKRNKNHVRKEILDFDLVCQTSIETLKKIFPTAILVGAQFGVLKIKSGPYLVDLAVLRKDGEYNDYRHPSNISIGTQKDDQSRRDFTINALYLNLSTGELTDNIGGIEDLKKRRIKTVGNPATRFQEDALRILRAARFSSQLNFSIEKNVLIAMKDQGHLLVHISRERVRNEITKAIHYDAKKFFTSMRKAELFDYVFPHSAELLAPNRWATTVRASTKPLSLSLEQWLATYFLLAERKLKKQKSAKWPTLKEHLKNHIKKDFVLTNGEEKRLSHFLNLRQFLEDPAFIMSQMTAMELLSQWTLIQELTDDLFLKKVRFFYTKPQQIIWKELQRISQKNIQWPSAKELRASRPEISGPQLGEAIKEQSWAIFAKHFPITPFISNN